MLDRNLRARLIFTAERLNRATRRPQGGGALGLATLSIYRCLLFRFGDQPSPTYRAIRTATGHCVQTIAVAIRRLEAAGLLLVTRGSVRTRLGPRKVANAYGFPSGAPTSLILVSRVTLEQSKTKSLRTPFPPLETLSASLMEALGKLKDAMRLTNPASGQQPCEDG